MDGTDRPHPELIRRTPIMRHYLLIALAAATGAAGLTGTVTASADSAFSCAGMSGGVSGVPATVSGIRVAHHDGYDRLVVEFAPSASGAIPAYQLTPQASAQFTRDASGQPVTLDGAAGIRGVFRNTNVAVGLPTDLKPGLPAIREVANTGDFERVTSYGIGLASAACFRVAELSGPSRVVIDVQTAPDAAPATVAAATTVAPAGQASDATPVDLATTGHPAQPAPPAGLPITPIALGLLVLLAGLTLGGLRLVTRK
jgi:hypothetical protein